MSSLIVCTVLFIFSLFVSLANDTTNDSLQVRSNLVKDLYGDAKYTITAPFKWKGNDWLKLGIVGGTTGLLFLVDEPVCRFMQDHRSGGLDNISKYGFEPWGDWIPYKSYALMLTGGLLTHGLIAKNIKSKETAQLALRAILITGGVVHVMKMVTGRLRPNDSDDAFVWQAFGGGKSFPSGHAAQSFALATILAECYKESKWVPIVSYSAATLSGLSRVYDNKHWISDVFLGAVIGHFVAKGIINRSGGEKLSLYPVYQPGVQGICLTWKL